MTYAFVKLTEKLKYSCSVRSAENVTKFSSLISVAAGVPCIYICVSKKSVSHLQMYNPVPYVVSGLLKIATLKMRR